MKERIQDAITSRAWHIATRDAKMRMEWEGAPLPGVEPSVNNSQFPERVMIEAPVATSGIGEVVGPVGQPK